MQSLFKKRKSKRKDLEATQSNDFPEAHGDSDNDAFRTRSSAGAEPSAEVKSVGKEDARPSLRGRLKNKKSSKTSVAARAVSPSQLGQSGSPSPIPATPSLTDSHIVMDYALGTQCEKFVPGVVLGKGQAVNTGTAEEVEKPARLVRSVHVAGRDVTVRSVQQEIWLVASAAGSSASRRILSGDVLLAVNGEYIAGKPEQAVVEMLSTPDEVELQLSSLQELVWAVGIVDADTSRLGASPNLLVSFIPSVLQQ